MQKDFEKQYHDLEDEHFWFVSRRDCLARLIDRLALPGDAEILDIGCASGQTLSVLRDRHYDRLTGIDISEEAIRRCKQRGFDQTHVMDGGKPDFADNSFDLIIASDVLEHIEDDQASLRNWASLLKPGGQLIVFVPAFELLWTGHDEINRHHRRYRRPQLTHRIRGAGLDVIRSGYWNSTLFPAIAIVRLLKATLKKTTRRAWMNGEQTDLTMSDLDKSSALNPLLKKLLHLENRVLASGFNPPFGVSTYAIARRTG